MLLFDTSKKLEKAFGEEAAAVLAHAFEQADEKWRSELSTKADIQSIRDELAHMATKSELAAMENRLIKWMVGGFLAQMALMVALMAFLIPFLKQS